ncbi:MBOAT family protein [Fusibacter paucivorans]|uniref:MBOAT family protein n=1 Tax=Fusibacter paucivorans TaxID=76009 RepID=A0ABS5PNZ4_9FIRM|nr:MBOAT family O-acyltransferase [Fusibacter paucivorans]MBS7526612.1 MBOAT family protein [Fusibacter paucivorans]
MVFSSTIFLFVFLPITLIGYFLLDRRFKNAFLLAASLIFYAWGEPRFVFVMLFSIFVNYLAALGVEKYKKANSISIAKIILLLAVAFNLLLFFVFKYLNFTISNINSLSTFLTGVPSLAVFEQTHILLPIGISFFTFQAMSYVFDVYYDKGEVQRNPFNVALYVSLFPQLIAGPIVRYKTVAAEIQSREETLSDFSEGVKRFVFGLSKKVLIANTIAVVADSAFNYAASGDLTTSIAWLGAISYTLQIYYDFSGYSDMAIGLGLMFGFHFHENFNYPYISKSISEFWRRWHISLGSWFRDYVYFPLGGSKVSSNARLVFNLFVVWFLTGVWHGANWTFLIWGLMYFVFISFEKLNGIPERFERLWEQVLYRVFTLLIIVCGWVLFRSNNFSEAATFLSAMFGKAEMGIWNGVSSNLFRNNIILILIGLVGSTPIYYNLINRLPFFISKTIQYVLALILFIVSISFVVSSTYNPFIYFNF